MNSIRIHPHGTGRVTDPLAVQQLKDLTPHSFRKAQDVVVAAKKYVKKSGVFSSERSRLQKMQTECYELSKALKVDNFLPEERQSKGEAWVAVEYLTLFSDTYPNWQEEYEALNRWIPEFF